MSRDPIYLHPVMQRHLDAILAEISKKLPAGITCKVVSTWRTPQEQFDLYKQGRTFRNGTWVKTGSVVTNIDGFRKLSNHNYLGCHSMDIGLFQGAAYLPNSPHYQKVKFGATKAGLDWGGDWTSFKDTPHIEIPDKMLFKSSRVLETAYQWQRLLKKAGAYSASLDGMFGTKSMQALKAFTGEDAQTPAAWVKLIKSVGVAD